MDHRYLVTRNPFVFLQMARYRFRNRNKSVGYTANLPVEPEASFDTFPLAPDLAAMRCLDQGGDSAESRDRGSTGAGYSHMTMDDVDPLAPEDGRQAPNLPPIER
ncbi:MAG: hypothetical protein ABSC63_19600 [Candidatus Binataceae bacterium]